MKNITDHMIDMAIAGCQYRVQKGLVENASCALNRDFCVATIDRGDCVSLQELFGTRARRIRSGNEHSTGNQ